MEKDFGFWHYWLHSGIGVSVFIILLALSSATKNKVGIIIGAILGLLLSLIGAYLAYKTHINEYGGGF